MPYTSNIRITQPNLYSFVFQDLNFLADNPSVISALTLQVTSSDGTTIDEVVNLVTAGMSTISAIATITNVMLGLDAEVAIPDDKYTLKYTYNFAGDIDEDVSRISNVTELWALVGNIEQYLYEQFVTISEQFFEGNPLRNQYTNELVAAYGLLKGLKIAATRGYTAEYTNMLGSLERLTIFDDYTF